MSQLSNFSKWNVIFEGLFRAETLVILCKTFNYSEKISRFSLKGDVIYFSIITEKHNFGNNGKFFSNFGKVFSIEVIYYLTKMDFLLKLRKKLSKITEKASEITIINFPQ